MNILFPGRHHLLTDFQFKYISRLLESGLEHLRDVNGQPLGITQPVSRLVFAVTSANHANTRRNPVPFHLRAMAILDFSQELSVPAFVYGIDDVGRIPDFAGYTIKKIRHETDAAIDLRPENTVVLCSSPVMKMYEALGFRILPLELTDRQAETYSTALPWELVERIGQQGDAWTTDPLVFDFMHQASFLIWKQYELGKRVQKLFGDDMISADGDLTTTRDYNSYVRKMDQIAELKYLETAPYLKPGRIGDIGCAAGTWIQRACEDPRYFESDFYGIEVAQHLYRICLQRKENGEFAHPYVFFAQKNAVTELCFSPGTMDSIHTSSLTHEIESYGDEGDLLQFIKNRYQELAPGGVWVNRDVLGPDDGDREVLMWLNEEDGNNEGWEENFAGREAQRDLLNGLSTRALFLRFARDFREGESGRINWKRVEAEGRAFALLALRDAMEFITKKDYHDNWSSEMHERFCFWSFDDWKEALQGAGFHIDPASRAYRNDWLVQNRFAGKAELYISENGQLVPLPYPVTHVLMVAEKRV